MVGQVIVLNNLLIGVKIKWSLRPDHIGTVESVDINQMGNLYMQYHNGFDNSPIIFHALYTSPNKLVRILLGKHHSDECIIKWA